MKTEGLAFPEAVERLAGEAGVPMPKVSAHDEAREDERERLYLRRRDVAAFFEAALKSGAGAEARRYIEKARSGARDAGGVSHRIRPK